jgi:hypothetical protein
LDPLLKIRLEMVDFLLLKLVMDKLQVLYRGAKEKTDVLEPQPLLESEKHRFPAGTESVVFATAYKEDALAYAIASRRDLGGFQLTPFWRNEETQEIGWKLQLNCSENDLPKDESTFLFSISSEGFRVTENGEWYATSEVKPESVEEIKIGDALKYFDEVTFSLNNEGVVRGEAQKDELR